MREGRSALYLHPRLEEAWLDPSQSPSLVSEEGSWSPPPGPSGCRARGRGRGGSRSRRRGCSCRRRRRVPSTGTLSLLTSGLGSPSTGGLEPLASHLRSQDGVADAILITVQVHFHELAASSQLEEGLEYIPELPDPSHCG